MALDYATLTSFREHHPAWRLLASPHAALVASFLHRVFIAPPLLSRLTCEEAQLFDDLRLDRIKPCLRLEQERIGYDWLCTALDGL